MSLELFDMEVAQGKHDHLRITPALTRWLLKGHEADWDTPELAMTLGPLLVGKEGRVQAAFHPSSLITCPRKQVLSYMGVPDNGHHPSTLRLIFMDGHWRHLRWQTMLLKAGIITHAEVGVEIPGQRFVGSIDGVNEDEHWGFELKGTQRLPERPTEEHVYQMHAYMYAKPSLTHFNIIYESKANQRYVEFRVDRDPDMIREIAERMVELNDSVNRKRLPDVIPPCKKGTGAIFNGCPYRKVCLGCDWSKAEQLAAQASAARGQVLPAP